MADPVVKPVTILVMVTVDPSTKERLVARIKVKRNADDGWRIEASDGHLTSSDDAFNLLAVASDFPVVNLDELTETLRRELEVTRRNVEANHDGQ